MLALLLFSCTSEEPTTVRGGTVDLSQPVVESTSDAGQALCAGCDILVVSICSLRRDHVGAYGDWPGESLTPTIDALAAEGVRFDQAYATSNFTLASLTSLLTGRFGSSTGVLRWGTGLSEDVPTLPEVLGYYGYASGAFTVDAPSGLRPEYGLARGFNRFVVIEPPRSTPDGRHREGEADVLAATAAPVSAWLAEQPPDKPLLAWLHTRSAHYPFVIEEPAPGSDPTGVRRLLWDEADSGLGSTSVGPGMAGEQGTALRPEEQLDPVTHGVRQAGPAGLKVWKEAYAESVARMDHDVAAVIEAQRARGRLDKTIVVIVADHGESLGDNGEMLHGGGYFDGVVRVPLVIRVPGLAPGRTDQLVSQVDLMPTLLELVGAVLPAEADGVSLIGLLRGGRKAVRGTAFSEGGPGDMPKEVFPGAVISPPWILMRQTTPCSGSGPGLLDPAAAPPPHGGPPPSPPKGGEPEIRLFTCLFDLKQPRQERNQADAHPEVVELLQGRWDGYRDAVAGRAVPNQLKLDPEFVELLQRTGYDFTGP